MKYVDISEYIDTIKNTAVPQGYWVSREHKSYIDSLSAEDYGIWCDYRIKSRKEYQKKYVAENKERIAEITARFKERHPEYFRDYYQKNREQIIKNTVKHWKKNKEKYQPYRIAYLKEYKAKPENKEKARIQRSAYYYLNYMKEKNRRGDYYLANREKLKEHCKINSLHRYWKQKLDVLKIRFLLEEK